MYVFWVNFLDEMPIICMDFNEESLFKRCSFPHKCDNNLNILL